MQQTIETLEASNDELARICGERLAVIQGVESADDEQLEVVHVLEAACSERLAVIEQLQAQIDRLQAASPSI